MSARARTLPPSRRRGASAAARPGSATGQSLVEFALVLPMLLVLLLGIADFGRVFAAGIVLESAARDGAEAAAQEFVQLSRANGGVLTATDYSRLHTVAIDAACAEAENLGGGGCPLSGTAVCVHDGFDTGCGSEAASADPNCTHLPGTWRPWDTANGQPVVAVPPLPYVEVRTCYRFTTIFNLTNFDLPFGWSLALGEVWLQRERYFVAGEY